MTRDAGVLRSATSLERGGRRARPRSIPPTSRARNLHAVSTVLGARRDRTARVAGHAYARATIPSPSAEFLGRLVFTAVAAPEFVPLAPEHEVSR